MDILYKDREIMKYIYECADRQQKKNKSTIETKIESAGQHQESEFKRKHVYHSCSIHDHCFISFFFIAIS